MRGPPSGSSPSILSPDHKDVSGRMAEFIGETAVQLSFGWLALSQSAKGTVMMQIETDHDGNGNATLAAIHNRLDLLEDQVASLERALVARDLMVRRGSNDSDPIILPSVYPSSLGRSVLPVGVALEPQTIAPAEAAKNAGRKWRSPLLAGAGMIAATLFAIGIIG
jgi:hypothetical protein